MSEISQLCNEIGAALDAALRDGETLRTTIADALKDAEDSLETMERDFGQLLETVDSWTSLPGSLANADEVISTLPERARAFSEQLQVLLPRLMETAAADALSQHRAAVNLARERVEEFGAQLVERISQARGAAEEAVEKIEGIAGERASTLETLSSAVTEWVAASQASMEAMTSAISERIEGVTEDVDKAAEELRAGMVNGFLESANESIAGEVQRLSGAIGDLGTDAMSGVGDLRDNLATVTDQLQAILDLIEPAKPVLDQVATVA